MTRQRTKRQRTKRQRTKRSQKQKSQRQGKRHDARQLKERNAVKKRKARNHRRRRRAGKAASMAWSAYRSSLVQAIAKWLPGQFFSRWGVARGTLWTPHRIFWLAMLMAWSPCPTLQTQFDEGCAVAKSLFPKWALGTSYTGWYEAQLKWIEPLRPALADRMRRMLRAEAGRHWLREGWCAFAVDGSRLECPRTAANEAGLGCAGRDKTGPQLFLTTLLHMGTGLPWDFRIGPGTASERRHLEEMLEDLAENCLVVADAGFTGFELLRHLLAAKKNFLIRVGAHVHLLRDLTGGEVDRQGDIVTLWPRANRCEAPIVLRLIEQRIGKQTRHLVTNVLDESALTEKSVGVLYEMRWGVEVFFRSFKQTMEKRRLLSRTPESAQCELTWAVLSLWLLQSLTVSAMLAAGNDPLRWSAAQARDRIRASMRRALQRDRDRNLTTELAWAQLDDYVRTRAKKARNWPHKKKEKPPGRPKIRLATDQEKKTLQRLAKKLGNI